MNPIIVFAFCLLSFAASPVSSECKKTVLGTDVYTENCPADKPFCCGDGLLRSCCTAAEKGGYIAGKAVDVIQNKKGIDGAIDTITGADENRTQDIIVIVVLVVGVVLLLAMIVGLIKCCCCRRPPPHAYLQHPHGADNIPIVKFT